MTIISNKLYNKNRYNNSKQRKQNSSENNKPVVHVFADTINLGNNTTNHNYFGSCNNSEKNVYGNEGNRDEKEKEDKEEKNKRTSAYNKTARKWEFLANSDENLKIAKLNGGCFSSTSSSGNDKGEGKEKGNDERPRRSSRSSK